jgi:hypothetical protein
MSNNNKEISTNKKEMSNNNKEISTRYFCYGCGRFVHVTHIELSRLCEYYVTKDNKQVRHCVCTNCNMKYPNTKMEDLPRAIKTDHIHTFVSQTEIDNQLNNLRGKLEEVFAKYRDTNRIENKNEKIEK